MSYQIRVSKNCIQVRRFVILALAQLVHFHPKNRGIIFANDVIKTVLPMMSIDDDDLVVGILSLLTSISSDDQAHQEAVECDLFSKIRDMLPRTRSADIHRRSLQVLLFGTSVVLFFIFLDYYIVRSMRENTR